MRLIHDPNSPTYQRSELRAAGPFNVRAWWATAGQLIPSLFKDTYDSFEINYPCWIRSYDAYQLPVVQLIEAENEAALLGTRPLPDAVPVQPGISWIDFGDDEPEPEPMPGPQPQPMPGPQPQPGEPAHRVLVVTEVGSPNMIVRPTAAMRGQEVDLTIVQRPAGWFDRLDTLLGEGE